MPWILPSFQNNRYLLNKVDLPLARNKMMGLHGGWIGYKGSFNN